MWNLACCPVTVGGALVITVWHALGGVALMLVICPASAVVIGFLRRHSEELSGLYLGYARRRRQTRTVKATAEERARAIESQGTAMTELNEAAMEAARLATASAAGSEVEVAVPAGAGAATGKAVEVM